MEPEQETPPPPLEELVANLQCDELTKLLSIFPDLDFSDVLSEKPHLADYIKKEIQRESASVKDPLGQADAPKLDENFNNYFVINNLP